MITTRFRICAVPRDVWERTVSLNGTVVGIRSFVQDALAIERRLPKGVNLDNERVRYNLCCAGIEATIPRPLLVDVPDAGRFQAAILAGRLPTVPLGADYLDILAHAFEKSAARVAELRLGRSFFPPDTVGQHITGFRELTEALGVVHREAVWRRAAFFDLALQFDCGVVELQDAFHYESALRETGSFVEPPVARLVRTAEFEGQPLGEDGEAIYDEGRERNLFEVLRAQVREAMRAVHDGRTGAVNFSNQPHNVITEVLNEFVYDDPVDPAGPLALQVVYTDGSQGMPFPLRCLRRRSEAELADLRRQPPLRAALLSMRHLQMDREVDMSWFRNREVSRSRALGETDEFCYRQSRKQLREARILGSLVLHIYQTGLQPAVIGLYRALVEELMDRSGQPPSLEVVPFYFGRRGGYRPGKPWN